METGNYLRVGGLASGMDLDSIVKDLMRAERLPLDKLQQERQLWEWRKEAYREINTSLNKLREEVFQLKLQGTFMVKEAESSHEAVVTAAAGANAVPGTYQVTVNNLAAGVFKGSTAELAEEALDTNTAKTLYQQFQTDFDSRGLDSSDTISLTLNGKEFTFNLGTDNIYTVVGKINKEELGVTASYDRERNRFFLTTVTTGNGAQITVTDDSANFFSSSGDQESILKLNLNEGETYSGVDASFDFGDALGLTSATNTAQINGITLSLKQGGGAAATISVKDNPEEVFKTITSFVERYNQTLKDINSKLSEERYRNYPPLSEAQKEVLSERQIELWEQKARSGMLANDSLLYNTANGFRQALSRIVEGLTEKNNLAAIGITTKGYLYKGELEINEDVLREALQTDLAGVRMLFTGEKGLASQLYDEVVKGIERIADRAGSVSGFSQVDNSYIGRRLQEVNKRIEQQQKRLVEVENRYWKQFIALEKAIDRMNMQSMWLAQQLGMGTALQR